VFVTLIRSRPKPGVRDEYTTAVDRIGDLVQKTPGYVFHKSFVAKDGDRITIVEFEHEEGLRAWRMRWIEYQAMIVSMEV